MLSLDPIPNESIPLRYKSNFPHALGKTRKLGSQSQSNPLNPQKSLDHPLARGLTTPAHKQLLSQETKYAKITATIIPITRGPLGDNLAFSCRQLY